MFVCRKRPATKARIQFLTSCFRLFASSQTASKINDGFMGMSRLEGNVLFNGCRESNTHGNFNSWVSVEGHLESGCGGI
jgi:hypothetical protein